MSNNFYYLFTLRPELGVDIAPDKFFNIIIRATNLEEAKNILLPKVLLKENLDSLKVLGYVEFEKQSPKTLDIILKNASDISAYPVYSLEDFSHVM